MSWIRACPAGTRALIISAVIALVGAGCESTLPSAVVRPSPSPLASQGADDHVVVSGDYSYRIALEAGRLVVSMDAPSGPRDLADLPAPEGADASPPTISWAQEYLMACASSGTNGDGYFFFGHVSVDKSPLSTAEPFFAGPPVDGQVSGDGLFLFVLRGPPPAQPQTLAVLFEGEAVLTTSTAHFADLSARGTPEPSGCRVR